MKLQTAIQPRRDGTVKVAGLNGKIYVFEPDAANDLVCDVDHDETAAHLLGTDNFWPADEADYQAAEGLLAKGRQEGDQDEGADDDDEPPNPNALPIEANTPPAVAPDKAAKDAARAARKTK
jgi:hypothetical protein